MFPFSIRADASKLSEGKVEVEMVDVPDSDYKRGLARGVIEASPAQVWRVITNYADYDKFMPKTVESKVESVSGLETRYFSRLDMPWPISNVAYSVVVDHFPDEWITRFRMVPGTGEGMKNFSGGWQLSKYQGDPNRTLAEYQVLVVPSQWYPRWVVEMGTKSSLGEMMDAVRNRLKTNEKSPSHAEKENP